VAFIFLASCFLTNLVIKQKERGREREGGEGEGRGGGGERERESDMLVLQRKKSLYPSHPPDTFFFHLPPRQIS